MKIKYINWREIMTDINILRNSNPFFEIHRSPEEIVARIDEIKEEIHRNDIWIDTGIISKCQEPESLQKQTVLTGKLLELKWLLGEEVKITEGLF
jgi:hypothetical protein